MDDKRRILIACLGLVLCSAGVRTADAQSIWLEPTARTDVNLEILKPSFSDFDFSTFSLVYYPSARIETGQNLQIVLELPFAHYAPGGTGGESDNALGNPYVGVDIGPSTAGWQGEIGVRLPVADENKRATYMAQATDIVDRAEAFQANAVSVNVGMNYRHRTDAGMTLRLRLTPTVWLFTGDYSDEDPEAWVLYAAQIGYADGRVAVGGGLSGRYLATESDLDFSERTLHQFALYGNYGLGDWAPGLQVRFPLDEELQDALNPTFCLSVSYRPR